MVNEPLEVWRILLVDDDEDDYIITRSMLAQAQGRKIELDWAPTYEAGRQQLQSNGYSAVLVDYDLGLRTGIELIRETVAWGFSVPLILYTGRGSFEVDQEALQVGATLYLTKSEVTPLLLERSLRYAIERKRMESELRSLALFPDENPNPVMRLSAEGELLYANNSSKIVLENWAHDREPGLPNGLLTAAASALKTGSAKELYVECGDRTISFIIAPIKDQGYINLYGRDISERKRAEEALREANNTLQEQAEELEVLAEELKAQTEELAAAITHLRKSEKKAQHSLAELRSIYAVAPVGLCFLDADLRYRAINQTLAEVNGLPAAAHIGKTLREVLVPEIAETVEPLVRQVLETGNPVLNHEINAVSSTSNRPGHWLVSYQPVIGDDGSVIGVSCVMQDVTEQKYAEQALQERVNLQDQLAKVAATVPGMISTFRLRPDGSFCMPYASPALEDLYGLQPEDVIEDAAPIFSLIHPDDVAHVNETIAESARCMTPWRDEFRVRHPVKGEIWIEGHSMPERESGGSIVWNGFVQDITNRKRAEETLRRYELLAAKSRDVILFMRRSDGRILEANAAAVKAYGYSRKELLLLAIHDLRAPGTQGLTAEQMAQADEAGILFETVHRCKDGSTFPVEVSSQGATIGGERMLISVVRDIAERKQAEEALRLSQADLARAQAVALTGNWRLDVRRDELLWSDETYRIFGIPQGTPLTYEIFLASVHPEDRDDVDRSWAAALHGEPYDIEHRILVGGEVKWVRERAELEFDLGGQLLGGFGIVHDIHARKRAEEALREANASLQTQTEELEVQAEELQAQTEELAAANEKLHQINGWQSLLSDAAAELLAGADPIARLEDFFHRVSESLGLEIYVQYNLSKDGTHLELGSFSGLPEKTDQIPSRLPFGQAVCGTVAQIRKPMYVNDVQVSKDPKTSLIRSLGIGTYACLPLLADGRLLGTLSFGSRSRTHFEPETIDLLRTFCNLVATALARKQTEESLRQRAEEIEKLMDLVPAAIWVSHDPGCYEITGNRVANHFYEAMEGENVSAGPEPGKTVGPRRFFKDGRELRADELPMQEAAAKNVEIRDAEFDVLLPSGQSRTLWGSATPLLSPEGRVRGCIAAFLDISERKRAEDRTRRQNAILAGMNRIFQEALACQSENELGRICLEVLEGVTRSKIGFIGEIGSQSGWMNNIAISSPSWEACRMEDPSGHGRVIPGGFKIHDIYGQVFKNGQSFYTNSPASHQDSIGVPRGHAPLTAFLGVPLLLSGKTIGMVGLGNREGGYRQEDLEAAEALAPVIVQALINRRAEEALRASEERYRSLFNGMTEGFAIHEVILDETGRPCDYRFLDINPAFERMTGLKREVVVGRTHNEVLPGNDPEWVQIYGEVAMTGEPVHFENYSSALHRHYEVHSFRPALGQFAVIFMDITKRKEAELALAEANTALQAYAEQLKRSNLALEDFAFIASHDLREPLRKVQAFGDMLQTRYSQALDERGQDYIERMQGAAGRMQSMLDGLLTYARISTQGQAFKQVDLNEVTADVLLDLEIRLVQTGGHVECGPLPVIEADPVQMRQLLQNLVGNALKFRRPDEPPKVFIRSRTNLNGCIELDVEDNGIGFNISSAGHLFQPFHRLSDRAGYEGTGMGLAICRKIAERHGGSISVASQPGEGSIFTVTLPCSHSE